jgi:hypothetical protein
VSKSKNKTTTRRKQQQGNKANKQTFSKSKGSAEMIFEDLILSKKKTRRRKFFRRKAPLCSFDDFGLSSRRTYCINNKRKEKRRRSQDQKESIKLVTLNLRERFLVTGTCFWRVFHKMGCGESLPFQELATACHRKK